MSKYSESRIKHHEEYLDPRSSDSMTKQEDADVEDNILLDENYEKRRSNFSEYIDNHDEYTSDVFFTSRSNSPLSQTRSSNTGNPITGRKVSFSKQTRLPKDDVPRSENRRSSSIAASPLFISTITNKKDRRQSAPATSISLHHSKEQLMDDMEREQERVVLKLMKQIHDLKSENQSLKRELAASGSKGNHHSKKADTYSGMNSTFHPRSRSLSNASTVYNPRNNSVSSSSFRENVLTDFESLK